MDILYSLVLLIVRGYMCFKFVIVFLIQRPLTKKVIRKLKECGLKVELPGNGSASNPGYKKVGYETSKLPGDSKPTMTIHDPQFFQRLLCDRDLGLADTYISGQWDCDQLDEFACKMFQNDMLEFWRAHMDRFVHYLQFSLFNLQSRKRAYDVAREHYDLGDALFESFLDPAMVYTCAYWRNAKNLTEAQEHKMDLVARKLKLKPGMRVLELGCGWGGLAHYLAKNYKVSVVACNIAKEGCASAERRCEGLPVKVRCCDYREINEKFDRVVAVGLMEHVGPHNYSEFFNVAHRCLEKHGLFLVHTIAVDHDSAIRDYPFFSTYIFPNGALPRPSEILKHSDKKFLLEDWQNFGTDYDKTLMAWHDSFKQNWHTIKDNYEDPIKFYRLWTYYLLMSAGAYRARKLQLWQVVLSKNGFPGGYESVR